MWYYKTRKVPICEKRIGRRGKKVKINRFLVKLFVILAAFVAATNTSAQEGPRQRELNPSVDRTLSAQEITDLWSGNHRVPRRAIRATSTDDTEQVKVVIEVVGSDDNLKATCWFLTPPPAGSFVAFRVVLANGGVMPLTGYQIYGNDWLPYGVYPRVTDPGGLWIPGPVHFEAVIWNSSDWSTKYIGAYGSIWGEDLLTGPLQSAKVTQDGTAIDIAGAFGDSVTASIHGNYIPTEFLFYSPMTGQPVWRVNKNEKVLNDILTVCSNGECSTRNVYPAHLDN